MLKGPSRFAARSRCMGDDEPLHGAALKETVCRTATLHHTGWGEGGERAQAYLYFDRSWGTVRANLKKRFEQGPQDWAPWLKQLEVWRALQAAQAA